MKEEDKGTDPRLEVFRPRAQGLQKMLGKLEAQVMEAVWDSPNAVCVEDVRRRLNERGTKVAYTTVMTTLSRLYTKGLLSREIRGKAYFYTPNVSRRELSSTMTREVIDGLLSTFAEPALSYFVEAVSESDPSKLDLLASLIEKKRQERQEGD